MVLYLSGVLAAVGNLSVHETIYICIATYLYSYKYKNQGVKRVNQQNECNKKLPSVVVGSCVLYHLQLF